MIRMFPTAKAAALLLIIVVGFGVYLNSLSGEFVYDDILMIPGNP